MYIQIEISHYQKYFIWKICILKWSYAFLKTTVVWTDQFEPMYWLSLESSIKQRTNCQWAARCFLGRPCRSFKVNQHLWSLLYQDLLYMTTGLWSTVAMFCKPDSNLHLPPPPPNQFLNYYNLLTSAVLLTKFCNTSPPIRFKPATQKSFLHLVQLKFFDWSCLFWWPNLVIH